MHAKTILLCTDLSGTGDESLSFASELAHDMGARLLMVYVKDEFAGYGVLPESYATSLASETQSLMDALDELSPLYPDIPCEHHLLVGDPAAEIVRFANDREVDMIVIGTHGRTGLMRLFLGSVAERVVRIANCPVITIKHHEPVLASTVSAGMD